MKTYIALLKGINVGGHRKIPMADLRTCLSDSGFQNVKTYIQSGNVIFEDEAQEFNEIEDKITKAILNCFGFEISVLVKTRRELQRIFDNSPFKDETKKKSYFMMLHEKPHPDLVTLANDKIYEGETYKIINDCIYYYSDKGMGKAKFNVNFFERKLKTFATARNYNTMVKLLSLSA